MQKYRIPLIWHPQSRIIKYSGLSDTNHTDWSSYRFLVCYCSYTWAAQLIRGAFHFDTSFTCWFFKISQGVFRWCALANHFHFIM